MAFCSDCGSRLVYDRESRSYVCERCGGTYTQQDLLVEREKMLARKFDEEKRKKSKSEYLEWWLSAKQDR